MIRYFPAEVVIGLSEIPGQISLCVPLAGCGGHCPGCHSPWYQDPAGGEHLTLLKYQEMLDAYRGKATCVCFMGAGGFPLELITALRLAKDAGYKTALYHGGDKLSVVDPATIEQLDYIKVGSYKAEFGGLESKTTNQVLYKKDGNKYEDITHEFWRNRI